jgi:atypical dual specificity phosphatase
VWLGKCVLARHVPVLRQLGITRVLNLQDEYRGPEEAYGKNGIEQLWLPVVDHMEPSEEQLHQGVEFVQQALDEGRKVYVHCQGGHGRSGKGLR